MLQAEKVEQFPGDFFRIGFELVKEKELNRIVAEMLHEKGSLLANQVIA